ncbi:very short patch repair endonuclease [Methylocystis sp.]|uniref:very short patch repair endonuclease n=1 Tax=Methylocystis sp. TaxID=1911079 RepID=UPI003DA65CAE
MADFVTPEKRSKIMRGVKGANTRPELRVRSLLHAEGYRFSLHRRDLPGRPDICLPKYRSVVLVHGCFWHHHDACGQGRIPTSNRDFWNDKISRTRDRDVRNARALRQLGWNVITVWECELADETALMDRVSYELKAACDQVVPPTRNQSPNMPGTRS